MPQVVASTLVNMVKDLDNEEQIMKTLAAGGFKDITRIASSDPKMWQHICKENKSEIVKILKIFVGKINDFIDNIDDLNSVYNYFDRAKEYRDSFVDKKINGSIMIGLDISIKDENGSIARVATILSNNNINIKNIEVVNNREENYGALKVIVENYEEMNMGYDILIANGYEVRKIN